MRDDDACMKVTGFLFSAAPVVRVLRDTTFTLASAASLLLLLLLWWWWWLLLWLFDLFRLPTGATTPPGRVGVVSDAVAFVVVVVVVAFTGLWAAAAAAAVFVVD